MTNDELKDLFEDKFKFYHSNIESQFTSVRTVLESIDAQVKKTNGRVTKLEEVVIDLRIADANHFRTCPQIAKIKEIEDSVAAYKVKIDADLQEYNFFKKYPKTAVGIVAGIVVIAILSISQYLDFVHPKFKLVTPQAVEVKK